MELSNSILLWENEQEQSDIHVTGLLKNGHFYYTVNKSLKIFGDEKLSELLYQETFDFNIICRAVSNNEEFLAVCLESGIVKVIKMENPNNMSVIYSECLSESVPQGVYSMEVSEEVTDQLAVFLTVFDNGSIYRISVSKDNVGTEEIFSLNCNVTSSSYSWPLIVTNGGSTCNICNIETKNVKHESSLLIKRIFPFDCKFLYLDYHGKLWRLCSLTMKSFVVDYDCLLDDILPLQHFKVKKIITITKPNELGEFCLQFLETNFQKLFSLKLAHPVHLIEINSAAGDVPVISNIIKDGNVKELRFQTVYETEPESRYKLLMKMERFEEAEAFATMYNIDPSVIVRCKIQCIIDRTKCSSEDINTLIYLMGFMNDNFFKVQCCANVKCSTVQDVGKVLIFGSQISPDAEDKSKVHILSFKKAMLDKLFRLETYNILSGNNNIELWEHFSNCNLLDEVKYYLEHEQIEDALLIYSRLDQSTMNQLNDQYITDILEKLDKVLYSLSAQTDVQDLMKTMDQVVVFCGFPSTSSNVASFKWDPNEPQLVPAPSSPKSALQLPQKLYQYFLQSFIPITMAQLPSATVLFVNWLVNKTYQLEEKDFKNFPENAISLVEGVLKLFKFETHNGMSLQGQCIINRRSLEELALIFKGLKQFLKLKKDFGIIATLSAYLEGPNVFVRTILQTTMHPDLYDSFLKKFLHPYILENNINPDTIYAIEINNLLHHDSSQMPIVEVILKHVSSLDIKLQISRDILAKGAVPWCDITRRIAQQALQFSHPLSEEIAFILNNGNRYMVLRHPNYEIKAQKLELDIGFRRVVKRIIHINEPQMVDDIFHLCQTPEEHVEASCILADHLISKSQLDQAMDVVNKNKEDVIPSCARRLFDMAVINFNAKYGPLQVKENYYKVLPMIHHVLLSTTNDNFEKENITKKFRSLSGVYYFNQQLRTSFTVADFSDHRHRVDTHRRLLEFAAGDLASADFSEVLQYSEKIAFHFGKNREDVLVELCDQIKKIEILIEAGEHLHRTDTSAKNLGLMTTLFLKYLGHQVSSPFDETFAGNLDQTLLTMTYVMNQSGNDIFVKAIKLGQRLVSKAYTQSDFYEFEQLEEVFNWIYSCSHLIRSHCSLHDLLNKKDYSPKQNAPSGAALNVMQNCYQTYVNSIDKERDLHSKYLTHFSTSSKQQEAQLAISSLSSAIDIFSKEGQQFTAYAILRTLTNSLSRCPTRDAKLFHALRHQLFNKCHLSLLSDVVSAEYIDLELLYNLLIIRQDYLKYIAHFMKTYKRHVKKLAYLSYVGLKLLTYHNATEGKDVMIDSIKCAKWWQKLTAIHATIFYDDFFKADPDTRLRRSISLQAVGVKDVQTFCTDFNLDVDIYYKEMLKSCLMNFKPDYEIVSQWESKRTLVMKTDDNFLYEKCLEIMKFITDENEISSIVQKMLHEVNFYHYEVFHTIYKILENNSQTSNSCYTDMLTFLKNYTRCGIPSQREKEKWYGKFPDTQILDPLSEFRLPFTQLWFTNELWSILRPEISLNSYKLWIRAAKILKPYLKIDEICVFAVKEVISNGTLGDHLSKDWILYSKFQDLLAKVDECVQYISSLEKATSVVYQLMNYIPNGADKVKAAELSLKYATKYKNQAIDEPDIENAFIKVKNKYYGLSVRHILHEYNLVADEYVQLATQPEILIENLYMDERITKHAKSVRLDYFDINNAVDALSNLFKLNVQEIRLNLLNRFLDDSNPEFDITMFSMPPKAVNNQSNDEDNLKRAAYICSSGNQVYWQNYLVQAGLNEDSSMEVEASSWVFRKNALKCLYAITDQARIEAITHMPYTELLKYIDKVSLLSELNSLGIYFNLNTLARQNMKELLKRLSNLGKPAAIKCMGTICIIYKMEDDKYWKFIINSSIKFEMISELKTYVEFLKHKSGKDFYVRAWQVIIDKMFQHISHISEDELEETLMNNFSIIETCPIRFSLNFENIMKICKKLDKRHYCKLLMQYVPKENRIQMLNMLNI